MFAAKGELGPLAIGADRVNFTVAQSERHRVALYHPGAPDKYSGLLTRPEGRPFHQGQNRARHVSISSVQTTDARRSGV